MTERLSHKDSYLTLTCSEFINELGKGTSDDVTKFEERI